MNQAFFVLCEFLSDARGSNPKAPILWVYSLVPQRVPLPPGGTDFVYSGGQRKGYEISREVYMILHSPDERGH